MRKLKLTVNEQDTRSASVREGEGSNSLDGFSVLTSTQEGVISPHPAPCRPPPPPPTLTQGDTNPKKGIGGGGTPPRPLHHGKRPNLPHNPYSKKNKAEDHEEWGVTNK